METLPDSIQENKSANVAPPKNYPGISRLPYFLSTLVLGVIIGIVEELLEESLLSLVITIPAFIGLIWLSVVRIRNIGYSGWWVLVFPIPILGALLGIFLIAYQTGFRDIGKLDKIGRYIVCLLILLVLGPIVFIGTSILVM